MNEFETWWQENLSAPASDFKYAMRQAFEAGQRTRELVLDEAIREAIEETATDLVTPALAGYAVDSYGDDLHTTYIHLADVNESWPRYFAAEAVAVLSNAGMLFAGRASAIPSREQIAHIIAEWDAGMAVADTSFPVFADLEIDKLADAILTLLSSTGRPKE